MTTDAAFEAIRALPPLDRRVVAETILDELDAAAPESISDSEREFIDHRIAEYRSNPHAAVAYDEVVARVRAKHGR
jgi:putative addiction module component (TIGR02574 family)